ncbi:hypothetical protein MN116_002390 [Schistosoma mekongi]|uniref:K Homology domain-containing protein n=1 Tax=Schistosoma mekongi TaxID=38744 RepID=A0AAE1ZKX1_SCHME|nr:hypothetical protein MN116_002390 [Schistosoma mekongi]
MSLLKQNRILNDIVLAEYFNHFNNLNLKNNILPSNSINHSNTIIKRVTLKIDVSHTYHSHIIGRYGWNIQTIMMITQCHIHFPDSNLNHSLLKSNQVSISGQLNNVEKARKIIRSLLPVTLIFDVNLLQGEWLENFNFTNLCQYYEVNLTIRNKLKKLVKSVVIRTIEKNIRSLYIVWELIQELLLQYTKTCEINSRSWSNSLIYPPEKLWSGDIIQSNQQSTGIQSILNKKKKCGDKESYNKEDLGDEPDKEQVIMKSTFSSIASSHSSSSSIFHYDQFIKMNILNRNNSSNLYLIGNESNAKHSLSLEHKTIWKECKNFEESVNVHTGENCATMDNAYLLTNSKIHSKRLGYYNSM